MFLSEKLPKMKLMGDVINVIGGLSLNQEISASL